MSEERNYEGSHETSIANLIREFNELPEEDEKVPTDEIRTLYTSQREVIERSSIVKKYIPLFAQKMTRQILLAEHKHGYLAKKVAEFEEKMRAADSTKVSSQ